MGEIVGGFLFLLAVLFFLSGFVIPINFLFALVCGFGSFLAIGDPR